MDKDGILEKIVDPVIDGRLDGVLLHEGTDRWVVVDHLAGQLQLDLKNGNHLMTLDVHWVDHLVQVFQGGDDGLGDAFQHDFIHVVNVGFPHWRFLVNIDLGMHFTDQFVDLTAIVLHVLGLLGKHSALLSVIVINGHGTVLTFQHFDIDVIEADFNLGDGFLHDLDHFEGGVNVFLSLVDELDDLVVGLPLDFAQGVFQSMIHAFNTVFDERFFHRVQASDNFVITAGQ